MVIDNFYLNSAYVDENIGVIHSVIIQFIEILHGNIFFVEFIETLNRRANAVAHGIPPNLFVKYAQGTEQRSVYGRFFMNYFVVLPYSVRVIGFFNGDIQNAVSIAYAQAFPKIKAIDDFPFRSVGGDTVTAYAFMQAFLNFAVVYGGYAGGVRAVHFGIISAKFHYAVILACHSPAGSPVNRTVNRNLTGFPHIVNFQA